MTDEDIWSYIDGLRGDLDRAEARIRALEEKLSGEIRELWNHISNMPGGI